MRFGRVEGIVEPAPDESGRLRLTVTLETNAGITLIRDEVVPVLTGGHERNLPWQADQYTQETIGVDLAEQGWEAIGQSTLDDESSDGLARSARYAVRRL